MDFGLVTALSLGFWLGLKHALDPDHLVAVTTIVSENRSVARSSLVGTFWGLGHTASLLAIGIIVISFKSSIPDQTAVLLEMAVAVMLVGLGLNVTWRAVRQQAPHLHTHLHAHEDGPFHKHVHFHVHDSHHHRHDLIKLGKRPFIVGMVHGVAGSAVLTLAVLTQIPSLLLGLAYIGLFGLGSVGGMALMSAVVGLPFAVTARRLSRINTGIRLVAGVLSIVFGVVLGVELANELLGR